jgi:hypothetical protein
LNRLVAADLTRPDCPGTLSRNAGEGGERSEPGEGGRPGISFKEET